MHFAISIPQAVADGTFDPASLRAYLSRAESLGFHSAWTQEAVLSSAPLVAPLELLAFAAACTERLRLGCAVFVSPLHNPVHLAKSISTLDQLSRGRIEVGLGIGGRGRMFSAFEVDPTHLVARFQPLRAFLLLYALMITLLGATLAQVSTTRPRLIACLATSPNPFW